MNAIRHPEEPTMKPVLRSLGLSVSLLCASTMPASAAKVKLTGWFACEKCTASRVAKGDLRPSNPDCARQCIGKGDAAVFLSEQGKELLRVKNHPGLKDDLGYHVEVTGELDAASKTITVESVIRDGGPGVSCARPVKK
jgi:hypothetical protein